MNKTISLSEFSQYPAGRKREDGKYSAEAFRDDVLIPALKQYDNVYVAIDVIMLAASFLDEAFGELVGTGLDHKLHFVGGDKRLAELASLYMYQATNNLRLEQKNANQQ